MRKCLKKKKYFEDPKNLRRESIKLIFQFMNLDNDIVVMKVVLLYFLPNLLLAYNDAILLDSFYLNLVDDLEKLNEYSWEKVILEEMCNWICHAFENKINRSIVGKGRSTINIFG